MVSVEKIRENSIWALTNFITEKPEYHEKALRLKALSVIKSVLVSQD